MVLEYIGYDRKGKFKMKEMKKIISAVVLLLMIPNHCFAGTTAVVTVTATVLAGQSEISIDTSNIDFGAVSGSVSNRRFVAGPVKVSYFAGTSPWTIRVWTNNNPAASQLDAPAFAGLKGADGISYIPLKVWCDNYGPIAHQPGNPPNEENAYFWRGYDFNQSGTIESPPITSGPDISEVALKFDVNGDGDAVDSITPNPTIVSSTKYPVTEEPVWLRTPEYNEMIPTNYYTWRRLLTSAWVAAPGQPGSPGAGGDPYSFPVLFGIDVTGVSPQQYRTTTLTFQIIGE